MHCGGQASSTFRLDLILGCLLLVIVAGTSWGLITVGRGNQPVRDNDWPAGSLDVANLKSRVGWWEGPPFGGGQHQFLYRGDVEAFQRALDAFAKIETVYRLAPGALRMELMIETPQSIFDERGAVALPHLIKEGRGRITAAHFGTYDYTASLGISTTVT